MHEHMVRHCTISHCFICCSSSFASAELILNLDTTEEALHMMMMVTYTAAFPGICHSSTRPGTSLHVVLLGLPLH